MDSGHVVAMIHIHVCTLGYLNITHAVHTATPSLVVPTSMEDLALQ